MKKTVLLALAAALALNVSCHKEKKKPENPLDKAAWLLGSWENDSRAGKLSETWTRSSEGHFKGLGLFTAGSDTLFSEKLELTREDDDLYYTATVKDQNDGAPVTFALLNATDEQLVFENKEHDFPKKIVYTHSGDSLIAIVSGMKDGQLKTEEFRMRKVSK